MKIALYKTLFLIVFTLCIPSLIVANENGFKGKHTKEKVIKKEFKVSSDALLKVRNRYGNLNITSWNEDRVVIEVKIKTNGNNEERVVERLEEIEIEFENNNSLVSARTRLEKQSSWGWSWGKRNNVNVQIDYNIKVPVKNRVNLSNDYGNIYLDRIDGHATISCDYGRIEVGELRGRNNELRFDYNSKSTFEYINSAEIIADYSGFTIEKAENLILRTDYTKAVVRAVENLQFNGDYGSIQIDKVTYAEGSSDYTSLRFGQINGNVSISSDYGGIRIKEMSREAGNLEIDSEYTSIKIGYHRDYNFDFEISTEYAGVSGKDDFEIHISKVKTSDRYYKGFYGQEGSGNLVEIKSEYGGVSFSKTQL